MCEYDEELERIFKAMDELATYIQNAKLEIMTSYCILKQKAQTTDKEKQRES